jgi:hypothetical protein
MHATHITTWNAVLDGSYSFSRKRIWKLFLTTKFTQVHVSHLRYDDLCVSACIMHAVREPLRWSFYAVQLWARSIKRRFFHHTFQDTTISENALVYFSNSAGVSLFRSASIISKMRVPT